MLDRVNALPPALERAGEAPWRPEFNKCEVGREAYPACGHREVGIGSVVVASIWLAFFVIAAVHSLASGHWN